MARSFLAEHMIPRETPGFVGRFVGTYYDWGPCGYVEAATAKAAQEGAERLASWYPNNAWVGRHTSVWSWRAFWFIYRVDVWSRCRD